MASWSGEYSRPFLLKEVVANGGYEIIDSSSKRYFD